MWMTFVQETNYYNAVSLIPLVLCEISQNALRKKIVITIIIISTLCLGSFLKTEHL